MVMVSSSVTVWARHINGDSLRLVDLFVLECGEDPKKQVAGVGRDGSATRQVRSWAWKKKEARVCDGGR
jgi:hypothetical protein